MSSTVQRHALAVARASRGGNPDPSELRSARQQLAEAKIATYIERVVAEAPPLSPEQLERLAVLLRGGAA